MNLDEPPFVESEQSSEKPQESEEVSPETPGPSAVEATSESSAVSDSVASSLPVLDASPTPSIVSDPVAGPSAAPETSASGGTVTGSLRQPTHSRLRWVEPTIPPHEMATRRTGVAFLALILTTNCVPWTQLAQGGPSAPHFVSFAESLVVVGACFAAAVLLILAWFLGRRLPMDWGPRISNPRDSGLMLAVLSAGLNLTLAFIIHWQQSNGPISLRTFGIVWVLVVLPTEIAAGFSKGRASIPTPESHYKPPPRRTATRIPAVSQPAISSSAPDPSK